MNGGPMRRERFKSVHLLCLVLVAAFALGGAFVAANPVQAQEIPTAPLPECEDDGEYNFSPFDAIFVGHSRGFPSRACPGVSDFFYFEADAGDQIDLELLFSHDAGDLDLFVFEPVGWSIDVSTGELFTNFIPFTPVVAAEGTTQTDDEFVSFTADRSGLWFVEVRPGDIVSQEFDIELLSPCNDDRRENLSMADADLLSFASRGGGTACDGAPDYYFFDANVGDEIEVDLDFRPEGGDLDLALIAPDGVSVRAVSEPDADGEVAESLSFTADVSGTWYARVSTNPDEANHNHYRLELESPLPCVDDENEPNNDAASATAAEDLGGFPGRRDYLAEGWICSGPDAVDWYTFPVVIGGGSVLVEVEGFGGAFDLEGGDLVVTLFDPLGAEQVREGDGFFFIEDGTVAGTWMIRLELTEETASLPTQYEAYITVYEPTTCNGLAVTVDMAAGERPTDGDDVILGTEGPDVIMAGGGRDVICGLGGDDRIDGGDRKDVIFGGGGDDVINGGQGADVINAGSGDDLVAGGRGKDIIDGQGGDDDLRGNDGTDTLYGGGGDDLLRGGQKADTIYGERGNDTLFGGTRPDVLDGGAGNDSYDGGRSATDSCLRDPAGLAEVAVSCELRP